MDKQISREAWRNFVNHFCENVAAILHVMIYSQCPRTRRKHKETMWLLMRTKSGKHSLLNLSNKALFCS